MAPEPEPVGSVMLGWSMVKVGDIVLGAKDGEPWIVKKIATEGSQRKVDLQHQESGIEFAGVPVTGTVRRLYTAAQQAERALAVTQVVLGGEVVAKLDHSDERGHACPAVYLDAGHLAAHLLLFHATPPTRNVDGSESTYAQVDGEHRALHHDMAQGNPKEGTVPHWHDPSFDKRSGS